jgi:hypothetical protein
MSNLNDARALYAALFRNGDRVPLILLFVPGAITVSGTSSARVQPSDWDNARSLDSHVAGL